MLEHFYHLQEKLHTVTLPLHSVSVDFPVWKGMMQSTDLDDCCFLLALFSGVGSTVTSINTSLLWWLDHIQVWTDHVLFVCTLVDW